MTPLGLNVVDLIKAASQKLAPLDGSEFFVRLAQCLSDRLAGENGVGGLHEEQTIARRRVSSALSSIAGRGLEAGIGE